MIGHDQRPIAEEPIDIVVVCDPHPDYPNDMSRATPAYVSIYEVEELDPEPIPLPLETMLQP